MQTTTRPLSLHFLYIAIASGVIFAVLTGFVHQGRLHKVDFDLTVKLQDRFPRRLDDNVATLIDFGAMEIQAIIFGLVLLLLPLPRKTKIFIAAMYVVGLAITLVGKAYLPHPAPPYMFQRGDQGLAFPGLHVQVDSSYPSGHTYRVVYLASLCLATWIVAKEKKILLSFITLATSLFASIVLIGLIVLGKHWTSDVIGGIGLSVFLVSLSFWVTQGSARQ